MTTFVLATTMSSTAIIAVVIVALLLLAAVVLVSTARRHDSKRGEGYLPREAAKADAGAATLTAPTGRSVELAAAEARSGGGLATTTEVAAPDIYVPLDADQIGFTRRQFFNRSATILMLSGLGSFGAACIAFLWPKLGGGFGAKINVGKVEDVVASIKGGKGFFYLAEGRAWITEYPKNGLDKAKKIYSPPVYAGMAAGLVALYQKCPHLGCRVPNCDTSQWFECPCHGSQYNRVGEKKGGPAPRGMDRFGVSVTDGVVTVDTSTVFQGPAIGTNTTGQEAEGPHCIGGGEHK